MSLNIIGKGEVTPKQIAYMVDRYLNENGFTETRSHFRNEASTLLSITPLHDQAEGLIPLEQLLKEYVLLRQHKVEVEQEKTRVDNLLEGLQNVMDTYNTSLSTPPVPPPQAPVFCQQRSSGYAQYGTQSGMPVSLLSDNRVGFEGLFTPSTSQSTSGKRKGPGVSVGGPPKPRKARRAPPKPKSAATADKAAKNVPSETLTLGNKSPTNELMTGEGSSLVNCVVNEADTAVPTNSHFLGAPRKSASSRGRKKGKATEKEVTPPTNSTIHAKGKSPIISPPEADLFNKDSYSNMYFSGGDYSYAKLLDDLDLDCEGATSFNAPTETVTGSFSELMNVSLEPNQIIMESTSNVNQVIHERYMSTQGYDWASFAKFVANADESEFCQMLPGESGFTDKMT